jgi:hypothetical protein
MCGLGGKEIGASGLGEIGGSGLSSVGWCDCETSKGTFGSSHIVAPPNIWLAKILIVLLVAHDLANISKKNELHWLKSHWHAK